MRIISSGPHRCPKWGDPPNGVILHVVDRGSDNLVCADKDLVGGHPCVLVVVLTMALSNDAPDDGEYSSINLVPLGGVPCCGIPHAPVNPAIKGISDGGRLPLGCLRIRYSTRFRWQRDICGNRNPTTLSQKVLHITVGVGVGG